MKNVWKWILLGVVFFFVGFCVALPLMGVLAGGPLRFFAGQGMMSRFPMMGGFGGGFTSGWMMLPMLAIRCLLPLFLVAAVGVVIYLLVRKPAGGSATPPPPEAPAKACPKCGKPVEAGWVACPHCGAKIK
jgi:hypothetical protein